MADLTGCLESVPLLHRSVTSQRHGYSSLWFSLSFWFFIFQYVSWQLLRQLQTQASKTVSFDSNFSCSVQLNLGAFSQAKAVEMGNPFNSVFSFQILSSNQILPVFDCSRQEGKINLLLNEQIGHFSREIKMSKRPKWKHQTEKFTF